jgi:two-component system chemotaxis response regulator CheB
MAHRDLIVVGASAGGVEALRALVHELPVDLPATVLVVLHLPTSAFSALPSILSRAGSMTVRSATNGMTLEPGAILVAPPDQHLLIRANRIALGRGPKENGHRPAIDPLFRSAARWFGPRAIGVILSGTLDDGAAGLWTIAEHGGAAVVQDPDTALYSGMPRAALRAVPAAQVAPLPDLAKLLVDLIAEDVEIAETSVSRDLAAESEIPAMDETALADPDRPGRPAAMTCPNCQGAMFTFDEGEMVRYRCRVGHAWSSESLLLYQEESAETAVWTAIRALEEKAAVHRRIVAEAKRPSAMTEAYHGERAAEAEQAAAVLRDMLRSPLTADGIGDVEPMQA